MRRIGQYRSVLALGITLLASGAALAADPAGAWITERGEAAVRIARCGAALCGHISALSEPRDPTTGRAKTDRNNPNPKLRNRSLIGVPIVVGMKPTGTPGHWAGHVYNPEDGGFYPAKLKLLNPSALRLEGCMIKDVICDGQTWVRAR